MTSVKLTFNKPAVRQFIEGEETSGLRIKVENGTVMFMPSNKADTPDAAKLRQRTRGGFEANIEGSGADDLLANLKNPHGPFFVLRRVSKDWVAAEPYDGKDAPPKFEPHVRVWAPNLPKKAGDTVAKKTAPKKVARADVQPTIVTPVDPMERVMWAYSKLTEGRRPGRPSKELTAALIEAQSIKESFEKAALDFVANSSEQTTTDPINLKAIVEAYNLIGNFLRSACPEALHTGIEGGVKTRAKRVVRKAKDAPAIADVPVEALAETAPVTEHVQPSAETESVSEVSDDQASDREIERALQKLGLEEKPGPTIRRTRGKINTRAFNGESLVA